MKHKILPLGSLVLLLAVGNCGHPPPRAGVHFTQSMSQALVADGPPPAKFGVTLYESLIGLGIAC